MSIKNKKLGFIAFSRLMRSSVFMSVSLFALTVNRLVTSFTIDTVTFCIYSMIFRLLWLLSTKGKERRHKRPSVVRHDMP